MSQSIHRIFDNSEYELALDYLSNSLYNSGTLSFAAADQGSMDILKNPNFEQAAMGIVRHIVKELYGINIVQMANYMSVQEVFNNIYSDSIERYIHYCHAGIVLCKLIQPSISFYINKLIVNNIARYGIMEEQKWDPSKIWDFKHIEESNKLKKLSNPLNGFDHTYLYFLNPSYSSDAIRELDSRNIGFINNPLERYYIVQLLPDNNYNKILNTIEILHKYF